MKHIALYPGSFDPFTNGHLDILKRATNLFEKVIVTVAVNNEKKSVFSGMERMVLRTRRKVCQACIGDKRTPKHSSKL